MQTLTVSVHGIRGVYESEPATSEVLVVLAAPQTYRSHGKHRWRRGAELVNRYALEFFNQHLRGIESKLLVGPNEAYPEVNYPKTVYQRE